MNIRTNKSSQLAGLSGGTLKKKSKWWLWLIILLVILAIVVFALKKCEKNATISSPTSEIPAIVSDTTTTEPETSNSGSATVTTEDKSASEEKTAIATDNNSVSSAASYQSTVNYDRLARMVVRGKYGNNPQRKESLGNDYQKVQKIVNEGKGVWWTPIN
jgi:cytoskeletal protein RodZ